MSADASGAAAPPGLSRGGPKALVLVYPTLADPRWLQIAFLGAFVVYALRAPGFVRTVPQLALGTLTCVVIDTALGYWRRGALIAPVSGLITSLGLLLVCDSPEVWTYPLVGALSVLSKHLLVVRGKHLFNPLNFGIVLGLLFLGDVMTVTPGRWGGGLAGMLAVGSLGVVTVFRARRLDVSIAYALTFLAGALLRSACSGTSFVTEAAPATGAAFQLFALFMITDPMTTRPTRRGRVLAAIALGTLEAVLRQREIDFAPFYAAFVITALSAMLPPRPSEQEAPVWKPGVVTLPGFRPVPVPAPSGTAGAAGTGAGAGLRSPRPSWSPARLAGPVAMAVILGAGILFQRWRREHTPHVSGAVLPPPSPAAPALLFKLTEVAREVGIVFKNERLVPHPSLANIAPYLAGMAGASVAVADVDGDGLPDIYLTSQALHAHNALFRNKGDGTFEEVGAKAKIGDVNQTAGSLRALFFDYDNDGHEDLLLSTTWCPRLFHNKGDGTFEDVSASSGIEHCGYAYASNAIDYDGDGYLDIIIGDYYRGENLFNPSTTKFIWNRLTYADNGGPILVYHNDRGRRFSPVKGNLGITSRGFTHAVGIQDLRGTGRSDLYFPTDFNEDQLYLNEGGGRFVDARSRFLGEKYSRFGMNAEIADIDDDGRPAVYVTDIYEPSHVPSKNSLWKMTPEGTLENDAERRGIARCGWSWGAKFVDLDNDGALDLVVTNGMVSGETTRDYWYKQGLLLSAGTLVFGDAQSWAPFEGESFSGHQRKCLFANRGDHFDDITASTALADDESDGRGIAAIDVLGTGSLSLIEGTVGQYARFYRNEQRNDHHWIGFDLVGTLSNRDAFGAVVTIRVGARTLRRELEPANGLQSQSDHRLHFGLGTATDVPSIKIRWPSGQEQELTALAVDRYHTVTEPRAR